MIYLHKLFLIFLVFFCSCNEKRITQYEFEDLCVTRLDKGKITRLYFGCYYESLDKVEPSVIVKSNHDNSTSGFLVFRNHSVDVINNGGGVYFNTGNNNEFLKVIDIDNYQYDTILSHENFLKGNILFFYEDINFEKKFNKERNSTVKAYYASNSQDVQKNGEGN